MPHEIDDQQQQQTTGVAPGGLTATSYIVQETSLMVDDGSNGAGTKTVDPDERVTIIEWEDNSAVNLHAIGANDAPDCYWILRLDNEIVARTASPLGTLANPFSLTDNLGEPVTAPSGTIEYEVWNVGSNSQEVAGRAHLQVL